jgi:bifunctional non-homologous end joining protein LigD
MHVEDHPLDYYDFEGVIAAGEYGAGDVVVWDWGVWALAEGDDPMAEIARGGLHFALLGEKLRGRFALVRRGDRRGRNEWMLFKKHDDDAVAGWNPEDYPRSVKSGRTNDEVRDAPTAGWTGQANWAAPTADELSALDDLKTKGNWTLGGHELHLTNLDKTLFPPRGRRRRPITKRDLIRHYATIAPAMLPYLADRAVNMHRYPNGVGSKGFWHKEVPSHAPEWIRRWRNRDADPGETQQYVVPDSAATLAWLANFGALELHPWTSTVDAPPSRRGRCSTSTPVATMTSTTWSSWPACIAPPSSTSASTAVRR